MTDNHRKPPKAYQFKKGQTGNPNGRPRKTSEAKPSVYDIVADRVFTVMIGETPTSMSAEEALHLKAYQQAIQGDKSTWAELVNMIIQRQNYIDAHTPMQPSIKGEAQPTDPDNAFEAMILLGIAQRGRNAPDVIDKGSDLLLETWAVQMALERRALSTLDPSTMVLVRASTRNLENLEWPPRFDHG